MDLQASGENQVAGNRSGIPLLEDKIIYYVVDQRVGKSRVSRYIGAAALTVELDLKLGVQSLLKLVFGDIDVFGCNDFPKIGINGRDSMLEYDFIRFV